MSFDAFPLRGESDRSAVLQLWHDNFGDHRIRSAIDPRWHWLTEANPSGPVKICVVARRDTGEIIGSAGAMPRTLHIGGDPVSAAVLCDFVVDKQHRVAGAALALQRKLAEACFADGISVLYGFPNKSAFPVFARIGYKTVGAAMMMARPLRTGRHLRDLIPPVLAETAGFFVDCLLHAYDLQMHLRRARDLDDVERRAADDSFQSLWDEANSGRTIVGERTPAHLNWRYAKHPIEDCTFFCLTERSSGRLRGYVAYSVVDGKVNVLDALWASPQAQKSLFARFVWRMRALGHSSISVCYAGDVTVAGALRQLGFIQSKERRNFVCKVAAHEVDRVGAAAYDLAQWSLFDGELDI
ncbi:MAG: GNAT family N-acetyltransferase [Myxococcota bacterium]